MPRGLFGHVVDVVRATIVCFGILPVVGGVWIETMSSATTTSIISVG